MSCRAPCQCVPCRRGTALSLCKDALLETKARPPVHAARSTMNPRHGTLPNASFSGADLLTHTTTCCAPRHPPLPNLAARRRTSTVLRPCNVQLPLRPGRTYARPGAGAVARSPAGEPGGAHDSAQSPAAGGGTLPPEPPSTRHQL